MKYPSNILRLGLAIFILATGACNSLNSSSVPTFDDSQTPTTVLQLAPKVEKTTIIPGLWIGKIGSYYGGFIFSGDGNGVGPEAELFEYDLNDDNLLEMEIYDSENNEPVKVEYKVEFDDFGRQMTLNAVNSDQIIVLHHKLGKNDVAISKKALVGTWAWIQHELVFENDIDFISSTSETIEFIEDGTAILNDGNDQIYGGYDTNGIIVLIEFSGYFYFESNYILALDEIIFLTDYYRENDLFLIKIK